MLCVSESETEMETESGKQMEEERLSLCLIVRVRISKERFFLVLKLNMWLCDDDICIHSAYLCFSVLTQMKRRRTAYMPSAM